MQGMRAVVMVTLERERKALGLVTWMARSSRKVRVTLAKDTAPLMMVRPCKVMPSYINTGL